METMETEHVNDGIECKQDGNLMETMETERVNEGIEWKQDENMMELRWNQST